MQNKRGQELTVGTLILIVLGIIILVLLVLGYSMGWSNLWERINIFQGGSSLESVIQSCKVAVSSASTFTYCQDFKKVKIDGKDTYVNCEYSTIANALGGSTLNCNDYATAVEDKMRILVLAVPSSGGKRDCSNVPKVNDKSYSSYPDLNKLCTTEFNSCTDYLYDGTNKAVECETNKCPSGKIVPTNAYKTPISTTKVCCAVKLLDDCLKP